MASATITASAIAPLRPGVSMTRTLVRVPDGNCALLPHANLTAAMASERRYDPSTIDPKWQAVWERERTWEVSNAEVDPAREKSCVLEMLPYPSGEPHIGHVKNYAIGDAVAHFHRRT